MTVALKPPSSPREKQVRFANGTTRLCGTLLVPHGRGPHPGLLLVPGSGPLDRDATIGGFRPFRTFAEHLGTQVAVLRYDHRGAGESEGDAFETTTDELAGDAASAYACLRAEALVDPRRTALLGHSEGAIVAAQVAAQTAPVGLVLLAPPAVRGELLLRAQAERCARADGASPEQVAHGLALLDRVMECARRETGWDALEETVRSDLARSVDAIDEPERAWLGSLEEYIEARTASVLKLARSRWYRAFVDLDPAPVFAVVRCPVLTLFGERDLQVPPDVNRGPLDAALAHNPRATCITVESANHLFQRAGTGSPSEYATLEPAFAPGVLETITGWIVAHGRAAVG